MVNIALGRKPPFICIVPEKRKEITTEGGLNLNFRRNYLKKIIKKFKRKKIRISLFIEPKISDIKSAKLLNVDCIEIHTGKICKLINQGKNSSKELLRIKKAVNFANKIGLEVHAGHGLTYKSAKVLSKLKGVEEFNIGHFLVGSLYLLDYQNVLKILKLIKNEYYGIGIDIVNSNRVSKSLKKDLLIEY